MPTPSPGAATTAPPRSADELPAAGDPGLCAAFGDPHFITFDGGHTVFVGAKVFWLVKSQSVWVQGWAKGSEGKLLGIAVGGAFMQGHKLVLLKGKSTLEARFDGEVVLRQPGDEFRAPGLVEGLWAEQWQAGLHNSEILEVRTERQFDVGPWPERFVGQPQGGIFLFRFPGGVEITATGVDFMSVVVTMPRQAGAMGGYCGNFNGSPDDDAEPVAPSWNRPLGPDLGPVRQSQSLFEAAVATGERIHASEYHMFQMVLDRLKDCRPALKEIALQRCSHAVDARIRADCVFDVCTTGSAGVADDALAANILEQKVNSRGIPVLVGNGQCMDADGQLYVAFGAVPTPPKECVDVLRSLALAKGVLGAQFNEKTSVCEIVVEKSVDPTGVTIEGSWTSKDHVDANGQGLVSSASRESDWRCWQLD